MDQSLSETIDTLVGDTPVSEQISAALSYMARKDHTHDNYALRAEVDQLKQQVKLLLELVGDTSVADQISTAISNMK